MGDEGGGGFDLDSIRRRIATYPWMVVYQTSAGAESIHYVRTREEADAVALIYQGLKQPEDFPFEIKWLITPADGSVITSVEVRPRTGLP